MISIENINKAFENRVRLGIMSILSASDEPIDFVTLKSLLNLSDGNLSCHTRSLEELGYIISDKKFIGRKPNTTFAITEEGRSAFSQHINALEEIFKIQLNK